MNTRTIPKAKTSTLSSSHLSSKPTSVKPALAKPVPTPRAAPRPPRLDETDPNLWRMSGRHAVVYLEDAILAGELLATDPKNLARTAMAVYYDRKGKAYAWQVRFDTERWEEIRKRLGN